MNPINLPLLNRAAWNALPHTQDLQITIPDYLSDGYTKLTIRLVKVAALFEDADWNTCFIISLVNDPPVGYDKRYNKLGTLTILNKGKSVEFAVSIEDQVIVVEEPFGTPVDVRYNPMRGYTQAIVDQLVEQLYRKTSAMKLRSV